MLPRALLSRFLNLVRTTVKAKAFNRDGRRCGARVAFSDMNGGHRTRIMVFGDSNAFRPDGNNTCWPALLQGKDPAHLNVFNESWDGRTTRYDTGECHGPRIIASKLAVHAPLDYVIVMLGTNDVKMKYGPPNPAEIADGMRQILDLIDVHGGGANPILLTPPPMGNVISGDLAGGQSRIPPLAAEYRLLAMNCDIRLVDIHAILDLGTDLDSGMIHLNAVGRQKVANAVWENLQDNDTTSPD